MLWKCYTQYASKSGRLSHGHRTGKGQFSFQSQRRAIPNNVQTTTQLHSSHTLPKSSSKFSKPGFNSTWTKNFQDVQGGFRKGRGTRDQIANIHWIIEKAREFQKHIYLCFTKAFDCVDHNKLGKVLKEMRVADHLTCRLRNLCAGQEATVRIRYGTMDWFKIGKGVCQGYIFHPAYVTLTCRVHHVKCWAGWSTSCN